eukprot:scaffold117443_cov59-Attheya_sp.AAC.1
MDGNFCGGGIERGLLADEGLYLQVLFLEEHSCCAYYNTFHGSFRSDPIRTIRDTIKGWLWNIVGTNNPKSPVQMTEDDGLDPRHHGGSHTARMYATCSMGLLTRMKTTRTLRPPL